MSEPPSPIHLAFAGLRCGVAEFQLSAALLRVRLSVKAGFKPNQPRLPAGVSGGGRWTDDSQITFIQSRGPRRNSPNRQGRLPTNLSQETRLIISQSQMQAALREVRKLDPEWRPRPQVFETVEGQIRANETGRFEAQLRRLELTGEPPTLGPFFQRGIASPPPGRNLTFAQRQELDRIGKKFGCHGCGAKDNLSPNGHFYADHQVPRSIGRPSIIAPHCTQRSTKQGQSLMRFRNRER